MQSPSWGALKGEIKGHNSPPPKSKSPSAATTTTAQSINCWSVCPFVLYVVLSVCLSVYSHSSVAALLTPEISSCHVVRSFSSSGSGCCRLRLARLFLLLHSLDVTFSEMKMLAPKFIKGLALKRTFLFTVLLLRMS